MPAVQVDSPSALSAFLAALFSRLGTTLSSSTALFSLLARFSNLVYRLLARTSNDPDSWTSTLLPPLVALLAAYLSLVVAYRTLRSTVRLVWFGIKWGTILGIAMALWAWWLGEGSAVQSEGVPSSRQGWLSGAQDIATLSTLAGPLLSALQASSSSSSDTTRRRSTSSSSRTRTPDTPDIDVSSLLGALGGRAGAGATGRDRDRSRDSDDDIQSVVLEALQRAAQSGLGLGLGESQRRSQRQSEGLATRLVRGLFPFGGQSQAGNSAEEEEEWRGTLWTWIEALADGGGGEGGGRGGTPPRSGSGYQRRQGAGSGPAGNTRSRARAGGANPNANANSNRNTRRTGRGAAAAVR